MTCSRKKIISASKSQLLIDFPLHIDYMLIGQKRNHRMVQIGRDFKDHLATTLLPCARTPFTRQGHSKSHPTWPRELLCSWHQQCEYTIQISTPSNAAQLVRSWACISSASASLSSLLNNFLITTSSYHFWLLQRYGPQANNLNFLAHNFMHF